MSYSFFSRGISSSSQCQQSWSEIVNYVGFTSFTGDHCILYHGIYMKLCSADYFIKPFPFFFNWKNNDGNLLSRHTALISLSEHPQNLFYGIILIIRHYTSCIKSLSPRLRTMYDKQALITCILLFIFSYLHSLQIFKRSLSIAQGFSCTNILIKQVKRWRLSMLFKYSVVPENKIFFCFNKNFLGIPPN